MRNFFLSFFKKCNAVLGGIFLLLLKAPILALELAFTPLLFIDKIINGFIKRKGIAAILRDVVKDIFFMPVKLLYLALGNVLHLLMHGGSFGFTAMLMSAATSLFNFFFKQIPTNADFYNATIPQNITARFQAMASGPFIGKIMRWLDFLIVTSSTDAIIHRNPDHGPHNVIKVHHSSNLYNTLSKEFVIAPLQQRAMIDRFIEKLCQEKQVLITQRAEDAEIATLNSALICVRDIRNQNIEKLSSCLCFVLSAIEKYTIDTDAHKIFQQFIGYLAASQHDGHNVADDYQGETKECFTGIATILLDFLQCLPAAPYKNQQIISPMNLNNHLNTLLHTRLNQRYKMMANYTGEHHLTFPDNITAHNRALHIQEIQARMQMVYMLYGLNDKNFLKRQKQDLRIYAAYLANSMFKATMPVDVTNSLADVVREQWQKPAEDNVHFY